MKKKKAVALVLAASTSATIVMAKAAITAHADTLSKDSANIKNMKTYTNKGQVINVTSNLKVRQGASTNTQVLGYLKSGNTFDIVSKEGNWYKINFNNEYGYVYGQYVKELTRTSKTVSNGDIIGTGTVTNVETNLRFRSNPTLNGKVLGYFIENEQVSILGEINGWYKVNYQGQIGYVDGEYINFKPIVTNETTNNIVKKAEKGGVVHVQTNLRVRTAATTKSNVIGRLYQGNNVNIIGRDGDWYKIDLGNGEAGFVCADYVQILTNRNVYSENVVKQSQVESNQQVSINKNTTNENVNIAQNDKTQVTAKNIVSPVENNNIKVNTVKNSENTVTNKINLQVQKNNDVQAPVKNNNNSNQLISEKEFGQVVVSVGLRVRSEATVNSSVIGVLNDGEGFKITGKIGDWYQISQNGKTGYVFSDYVKIVKNLPVASENLIVKQSKAQNVTTTQNKVTNRNNTQNKPQNTNQIETESTVGHVVNINSNLRVRTAPNTTSSVVGYLLSGQNIKITGKDGNWYRIRLDNGNTGYVYSQYIQLGRDVKVVDIHKQIKNDQENGIISYSNKYGQVINIQNSLRIRSGASTNSTVLGYLISGQGVKVLAKEGNWYKINNNGKIGYVYGEYIKLVDHLINNNTSTNTTTTSTNTNTNTTSSKPVTNNNVNSTTNNVTTKTTNTTSNYTSNSNSNVSQNYYATFEKLYSILQGQIGAPYLWGGEGQYITNSSLQQLSNEFPGVAAQGRYNIPSQYIDHGYRGFDCSGLMDWAFSQIGINIGRTTYQQATAGRAVSLNDVRPGDLLFFDGDVHVGLYIGNGQWIVAPHSHSYVRVCNVPWSLIGSARRVLN